MRITTQKQVETVPAKGTPYALGNNLYLDVRSATSRAWLFIWKQKGRNRYAGLGSASGAKGHKVTLIEARRKAGSFRASIASGIDPRVEEKRQTTLLGPFADSYVTSIEGAFRSAKSAYSWHLSFGVHAAALRDIPVASITSADILAVLTPMWFTRSDAARRLRHRLERVLRTAKAAGLRSGDNPASMENLGLPKHKKRGAVRHHPAMPYEDLPSFMATLRRLDVPGSLPLQLLILTATRTAETAGARWEEFRLDGEDPVWTIPADRVKNGERHVVPLTAEMLSLLDRIAEAGEATGRKDRGQLFPDCTGSTMLKELKRIGGCGGYTVHGFRSSFRDWCGNETAFARDVVEETYGHEVGNEAERAYRRQKAMKKRRQVLEAWNRYAAGSGTVVPFAKSA